MKFYGFPRTNGDVGARNKVAILATVGCVNTVVRRIKYLIEGTVAITHNQGCITVPEDTKTTTRTLINLGQNPNIASVLVVGLGCELIAEEEVIEGIRKSEKRVEGIMLSNLYDIFKAIDIGARIAAEMVLEASKIKREPFGLEKLTFCTKCGSSDATSGLSSNLAVGEVCRLMTENRGKFIQGEIGDMFGGGELAVRDLCKNYTDGEKILRLVNELNERGKAIGIDLIQAQRSTGNIKGGLTTSTEKALGANAKGGKVEIQSVVDFGERVLKEGRHIMDSPNRASENLTGGAAGGAQLALFTTGRGAPNGHPILPVIKVCGNEKVARNMHSHIDIDVSSIIRGEETVREAGQRLYEYAIQVASGVLTKSEIIKYDEDMDILVKGPII